MWHRGVQTNYDGTEDSCAKGDNAAGTWYQTNNTFKNYTKDSVVRVNWESNDIILVIFGDLLSNKRVIIRCSIDVKFRKADQNKTTFPCEG